MEKHKNIIYLFGHIVYIYLKSEGYTINNKNNVLTDMLINKVLIQKNYLNKKKDATAQLK